MAAILFGSISTVADTSELQRQAFNQAFAEHGLDWNWDRDAYIGMLDKSGGQDRVSAYAESKGESVDAQAIHQTKSKIFQDSAASAGLSLRPGVLETIAGAKHDGLKVGLVTTTSPDNVAALLDALSPQITREDFDVVVDSSDVDQPKPDRAAYVYALQQLSETAGECVAIEDNVGGVDAAVAAGVTCVAFPNANTAGHDFAAADQRVEELDFDSLRQLVPSA